MAPSASGYLAEYPLIRVDRFTDNRVQVPAHLSAEALADLPAGSSHFPSPALYLLSHIHTDHLCGLEQHRHNSAPIYCSPTTKKLLLRFERTATRVEKDAGRGDIVRPYSDLFLTPEQCRVRNRRFGDDHSKKGGGQGRDLLHAIELRTPTIVPYAGRMHVRLTLLDSNHMAGSVMFLVEGERGAVLHTGDLRAEPVFLHALSRDHLMLPYLSRSNESIHGSAPPSPIRSVACSSTAAAAESLGSSQSHLPPRDFQVRYGPLLNIYVDDERMSAVLTSPTKIQAEDMMISYMRQYPSDTRFFLDAWCWGYEGIIHRVHKAFGEKVHVDRYKFGMYRAGSEVDFHLPSRVHVKSHMDGGRFHACERMDRCSLVSREAQATHPQPSLVVDIKFGAGSNWMQRRVDTEKALHAAAKGDVPWPTCLIVPFERHSCLSEIKSFIALFRPLQVTSNTANLENWFLMSKTFTAMLAPGARERMEVSTKGNLGTQLWALFEDAWTHVTRQGSVMAQPGRTSWKDEEHIQAEWTRFRKTFKRKLLRYAASSEKFDEIQFAMEKRKHTIKIANNAKPDHINSEDEDEAAHQQAPIPSEEGYLGDISGMPGMAAGAIRSPEGSIEDLLSRAGPMPPAHVRKRKGPPPAIDQRSCTATATVLDEELASRYLAYAQMYLGWRILNTDRASQVQAWKRVRRKKPDLASRVEEALHTELGVLPPVWKLGRTSSSSTASDLKAAELVDKSSMGPANQGTPIRNATLSVGREVVQDAPEQMVWISPERTLSGTRDSIQVQTLGDAVDHYQPRRVPLGEFLERRISKTKAGNQQTPINDIRPGLDTKAGASVAQGEAAVMAHRSDHRLIHDLSSERFVQSHVSEIDTGAIGRPGILPPADALVGFPLKHAQCQSDPKAPKELTVQNGWKEGSAPSTKARFRLAASGRHHARPLAQLEAAVNAASGYAQPIRSSVRLECHVTSAYAIDGQTSASSQNKTTLFTNNAENGEVAVRASYTDILRCLGNGQGWRMTTAQCDISHLISRDLCKALSLVKTKNTLLPDATEAFRCMLVNVTRIASIYGLLARSERARKLLPQVAAHSRARELHRLATGVASILTCASLDWPWLAELELAYKTLQWAIKTQVLDTRKKRDVGGVPPSISLRRACGASLDPSTTTSSNVPTLLTLSGGKRSVRFEDLRIAADSLGSSMPTRKKRRLDQPLCSTPLAKAAR
ncbi:PROTEIN ARTEMIS [Ceraceosorus bombacis]|uniref:PROTEIN ARTEMIS n=1 Tax=Ceraceosorus bombacis TaxID=401625 RepID=A0A0P1BH93_9BASI|nr:PROTEIN ARTEMIS [Ceraceosorus bombacis]